MSAQRWQISLLREFLEFPEISNNTENVIIVRFWWFQYNDIVTIDLKKKDIGVYYKFTVDSNEKRA